MINKKIKNVGNEVKAPKIKPLPMIRINTRIRPNQHKFIKAEAKRTGDTEGDIFRAILDKYIK